MQRMTRALRYLTLTTAAVSVLAPAALSAELEVPPFAFPQPMLEESDEFIPLFDGKSLDGWKGDPTYWRVEEGAIVGEITPDNLLTKYNSFLIWQGDPVSDFELRLQYRISPEGNGGVNYRSETLAEPEWTMRGYQFDIDGPAWGVMFSKMLQAAGAKLPGWDDPGALTDPPPVMRATGQNYHELGRHILSLTGQVSHITTDGQVRAEALMGDHNLVETLTRDGWNDIRIIARGNTLTHILNDRVVSIVIDEDRNSSLSEGNIGVQVHVGPPMKVEYRDIRLRRF